MGDPRVREIRLLAHALGAAITGDPKFFGPIQEYGRRLAGTDLTQIDRERLQDLSVVTERVETFFAKYRSSGEGFYISPSGITGSNDDLQRLRLLLGELLALPEGDLDALNEPAAPSNMAIRVRPGKEANGKRVFVVHGHEIGPREAVARLLRRLGLEPVILAEQPNQGRTIIEKFEAHVDVALAVVVMTPDDLGEAKATLEALADPTAEQLRATLHPRARQNVVLELGYFVGRLGRSRVVAIVTGEVERPSDVDGVLYVPFQAGWELELARELLAAGLKIDPSRLLEP